ncbi:hypothetical protein JXQ31_15525 [candidate division KSB1 bacterium]|nr:hypothetical protein [candidate division KSB1 bacterium]
MANKLNTLILLGLCFCIPALVFPQSPQISYNQKSYDLYPMTLETKPDIPSPYTTPEGLETVIGITKDNRYAIVPVTVENSEEKGQQLYVDSLDFPVLAQTGLHSDIELQQTKRITGRSTAEITRLGRPGGLSGDGFMAADEDIISVMLGDNRLVRKLQLTHPDLARPLLHIWNMMQLDLKLGRWNMAGHVWENMLYLIYNNKTVYLEAHDTKGGQLSIFDDGIDGAFYIDIKRTPDQKEMEFLRQRYAHLSPEQMDAMIKRLSEILTGEMEPMYIMRYGFYEGHTGWRTDPVTIAFIFGLRTIEEIETCFPGRLDKILTTHYTK